MTTRKVYVDRDEAAKVAESRLGSFGNFTGTPDEIRDQEAKEIAREIRALPGVALPERGTAYAVFSSTGGGGNPSPLSEPADPRKCVHGKFLYERCIPCEPAADVAGLIARLQERAAQQYPSANANIFSEAAAALEGAAREQRWIPVIERLPDGEGSALATGFDPDGNRWQEICSRKWLRDSMPVGFATHWMPLPAAPAMAKDSK